MERIGKDNYERYMVDYLDGQLSTGEAQELMRFLHNNPHLEEELRGLEMTYLHPEQEKCPGKEQLKQNLTLDDAGYTHFDELCISRLEGNLTSGQARVFDRMAEASTQRQHTWSLYRKTKLVPDASVVFEGKDALRQKAPGKKTPIHKPLIRSLYPYVAAAASVILLVGLYVLLPSPQSVSESSPIAKYISAGGEPSATHIGNSAEALADPDVPDPNAIASQIDYNKLSSKLNVEVQQQLPPSPGTIAQDIQMQPLKARYGINANVQPVYAALQIPVLPVEEFRERGGTFDSYRKMERFLNRRVSNTLASTAERTDFSLWDVAGAGLKGISKVTGKELALERHYNADGELRRLALKTESFSFSTRVNK